MAGGRFERGEVHRFCVDLTDGETDKLERLAKILGVPKAAVVKRLIEVASTPKREKGERLCICDGERRMLEGLPGV